MQKVKIDNMYDRDIDSNAVIARDRESLKAYKKRKESNRTMEETIQKVANVEARVASMEDSLGKILAILEKE